MGSDNPVYRLLFNGYLGLYACIPHESAGKTVPAQYIQENPSRIPEMDAVDRIIRGNSTVIPYSDNEQKKEFTLEEKKLIDKFKKERPDIKLIIN